MGVLIFVALGDGWAMEANPERCLKETSLLIGALSSPDHLQDRSQ